MTYKGLMLSIGQLRQLSFAVKGGMAGEKT